MATICMITISQLIGNWNDVALKVVREIALFAHIGFGIIFITYFFSNFMVMMGDNKPVYRILYRPNRMPYFTFRLAGFIATLAFIFYVGWQQYINYSIAGFYNYVGDLYTLQDNEAFAESFYEQSVHRAFENNRANYALAIRKVNHYNVDEALRHYDYANGKHATEFSLVNPGNLQIQLGHYFDAIRLLQDNNRIIPNSPVLSNSLGYAYSKVHNLDSAARFFSKAQQSDLTRQTAEANYFALAGLEYIPIKTDSVLQLFKDPSTAVKANALALATLFDQPLNLQLDLSQFEKKELDLYSATELNNYIILHASELDTTFIQKVFAIAADSLNADYSEALKASIAHAYYLHGNVYKALETLGELAYISSSYKGKYNYIMGLWTLEQDNPEIAASYFSYAETAQYKDAPFYYAVALTESGQYQQALIAWDSVGATQDEARKSLATQLKNILTASPQEAFSMNDPEKYQFCRYRIALRDTVLFRKMINSFQNVNYKAQSLLDMARRQLKADHLAHAIYYLNLVSGLELTDKRLFEQLRFIELELLASRREVRTLANQINKGITFDQGHNLEKILYAALVSEASGDTASAQKNYEYLARQNPYFETGILAAADFFRNKNSANLKAYTILVEAIQVNPNSIRLLKAYVSEAGRIGFEDYAASAAQRLRLLQARSDQ
jgi:hypothetical protein